MLLLDKKRAGGSLCAALALAACLSGLAVSTPQAHKGATSPYSYNEHVFPIFRDRCGRCHMPDGPTPMSLVTYEDAKPWAESIREHLLAESMPPWYVDPTGPPVRGGHLISPKELDILLTWAVGGAPEGDVTKRPATHTTAVEWRAGRPDVSLTLDTHVLGAGKTEDTHEFTVSTGLREETWIKAVDLLPGVPSMVRDAVVALDQGPVLAVWMPGSDPTPTPGGTAFRLPAGARLRVTMHYRKQWQDEQNERSDRSTVGLYFTDPPVTGRAIQTVSFDGTPNDAASNPGPSTFGGTLTEAARVLAIRPRIDQVYGSMAIDAVLPSGRRLALLRLHAPRPGWDRRYWLADPMELPKGAKIEVAAVPLPPGVAVVAAPKGSPLQVNLDFIAM